VDPTASGPKLYLASSFLIAFNSTRRSSSFRFKPDPMLPTLCAKGMRLTDFEHSHSDLGGMIDPENAAAPGLAVMGIDARHASRKALVI
jgi:hypothetical protein